MVVSIAVIGGGVTGTTTAATLCSLLPRSAVTLFDQGRGLGGRTSHRRVRITDAATVGPEDGAAESFRFDHGCQLFRADTGEFRDSILAGWLAEGLAAEWRGNFGGDGDFFGVPRDPRPIFAGVGGMHRLATGQVRGKTNLSLRTGTRVASVERLDGDGAAWRLLGVSGDAAYHDTPEGRHTAAPDDSLGDFDYVVCTDASMAQGAWHRASAGLPASFLQRAASAVERPRVVLFSALVAFAVSAHELDAVSFDDADGAVWFAAKTNSKPGFARDGPECWTLVSTPKWAAAEVARVPMRDPVTGAFRPQERDYLEKTGASLVEAFAQQLGRDLPAPLFVAAQRWGSAFPAPRGDSEHRVDVLGTLYDASPTLNLVPAANFEPSGADAADFVDGGEEGLFYAGDFCSPRSPGLEAAALSALHCAQRIAALVESRTPL